MKDNYTREELCKIFGLEQCDLPKPAFNIFKNLNKSFGESNVVEFNEQDTIDKLYLAESRNGFDKYLNDLIRVSGKQNVIKFLESKLDIKFIELEDYLNKSNKKCGKNYINDIVEAKKTRLQLTRMKLLLNRVCTEYESDKFKEDVIKELDELERLAEIGKKYDK